MSGVSFEKYDAAWWRGQHLHSGTRYWLVPDRNVITRVLEIAGNEDGKPLTQQQRLAAAVMAFGALTHANYDPEIALLEAADHHGRGALFDEMDLWLSFQNVSAAVYVDMRDCWTRQPNNGAESLHFDSKRSLDTDTSKDCEGLVRNV